MDQDVGGFSHYTPSGFKRKIEALTKGNININDDDLVFDSEANELKKLKADLARDKLRRNRLLDDDARKIKFDAIVCPLCLENFSWEKRKDYTCVNGHPICDVCSDFIWEKNITKCPICRDEIIY